MFSLMIHKLMHKKWMVFCLLIGNILLIAVAASYPLYRVSSFQKMLTDEFVKYGEENRCWPAIFSVNNSVIKGGGDFGFDQIEEEAFRVVGELGVEVKETVISLWLSSQKAAVFPVRDGETEKRLLVMAVSGMENHVELLAGKFPDESLDGDGFLEVMVSDVTMVSQDILTGDEYTFERYNFPDGSPCKVRVVGIYRAIDEKEPYWDAVADSSGNQIIASMAAFQNIFLSEEAKGQYNMSGSWNFIWDYEKIETSDVRPLLHTLGDLGRSGILKDKIAEGAYLQILTDYSSKANRIEATLLILQVPVLLLLCAFLYMIAGQMLQMEQNEISLMRSRGASKKQIIFLYLMQSIFLGMVSLFVGIPLGALFCKMLGSSTAFLEFSAVRNLEIRFTFDVILYVVAAFLLSVMMTTVPVISYSRISIVNLKQKRSRQKKALWKKLYLDLIFLAVSFYGFYSFRREAGRMTEDVLSGQTLNPLLYVSFSLFILGAGLLCVRLQPFLLKCYYAVFKNHLKPSTYASVLGTIRTEKKQEFIILFMILTVAIGISNTVIARTIVLNAVDNTRYIAGADITLKEKWSSNMGTVMRDSSVGLTYYESDFGRYQTIPGVETATKVLVEREGKLVDGKGDQKVTVMGIKASGFYQVTTMKDGLLPYSYADYLNVLAADSQAVIVSENFMIKQGYRLGDTIAYQNADGKQGVGYIYGFFTYWPTYKPTGYVQGQDGSVQVVDEYLIVTNLAYLQDKWGVYPYEIWMKVNDGGEGFYGWLGEQHLLSLTQLSDMSAEENKIITDTMFQGTNGILSMSFIVILLLCCVGYLIYWIMSIRSRELLFGVLRAMGMRKKEINWLLIVEQICSGFYAIVAGGVIGILSSRMFVPMIQQAYAASEQVLPLSLITRNSDLIQLFAIIGVVLCICLIVLGRIISRMNISSALKLGED